jgi:hypothetical protein
LIEIVTWLIEKLAPVLTTILKPVIWLAEQTAKAIGAIAQYLANWKESPFLTGVVSGLKTVWGWVEKVIDGIKWLDRRTGQDTERDTSKYGGAVGAIPVQSLNLGALLPPISPTGGLYDESGPGPWALLPSEKRLLEQRNTISVTVNANTGDPAGVAGAVRGALEETLQKTFNRYRETSR